MIAELSPLDAVTALLAAASRTPTLEARAVYVARARAGFAAERERIETLRIALDLAEVELARLSNRGAP